MMDDMDELVAWIREQLDEVERVAREAMRENPLGLSLCVHLPPEVQQHIARHDPARVLREVEAKRRLIAHLGDEFGSRLQIHDGTDWVNHGEIMLRLLALPFSDRPGYREEWRP